MNKKAEMGVGTLVVFIAMLLVAAVAAGVLITTIGTLQQKALTTGAETTGEISSHIFVVQVTGENGTGGNLSNLTILAKLAAGSDPINLEDTLMEIGLTDSSRNLRFNDSVVIPQNRNDSNYFFYWANFLINGTDHSINSSSLTRGDVAEVKFWLPRDVIEDEKVRIVMIPKIGTQTITEFRTPDTISTERIYLYP